LHDGWCSLVSCFFIPFLVDTQLAWKYGAFFLYLALLVISILAIQTFLGINSYSSFSIGFTHYV
jgi:hypothetical protein